MRAATFFPKMCGIGLLIGGSLAAAAQTPPLSPPSAPPAAPRTIFNFLGFPTKAQRVAAKDTRVNQNGNKPQKERVPPPTRIADPANLQSTNPAIKTAAIIKAEEDKKCQKIKAIKYLATVGCGCYPGVKEALMAALDDCTEEVRFTAACSIAQSVSVNCEHCSKKCCCDQEMSKKLASVVYDVDDQGCPLEASKRVRDAAYQAMILCCPGTGTPPVDPGPQPQIQEREVPVIVPEPVEVPETAPPAGVEGQSPDPFLSPRPDASAVQVGSAPVRGRTKLPTLSVDRRSVGDTTGHAQSTAFDRGY